MSREEFARVEGLLSQVAFGRVALEGGGAGFSAAVGPEGRGWVERYPLFPGAQAMYALFQGEGASFSHPGPAQVLQVFHCRAGRVGWRLEDGAAVYLGAGDLCLHSAACCADSAMEFPLGYCECLTFSVDLARLERELPPILGEAGLRPRELAAAFCGGRPLVFTPWPQGEGMFAPVYGAAPARRSPYLKLKAQELLLCLQDLPQQGREPVRHGSRQTQAVREVHRLLTEHLDQRFTIQELSKRYLVNTSTLKEAFKGVYGLPVATYMKEFRIRRAMELLRDTDESIAAIARQVGYGNQGKFTQAFKEAAGVLPKEYRKALRSQGRDGT